MKGDLKKMKRILKKGFTLVELVIVIAVIAVLAAVLIPTFSDIIEKAENSSDLQEARNLFSEALIEDPTITDGTVYVQLVKKDEVKYVIFTDGAPVDNNKDGNYTNEENIPSQEDLKAIGNEGALAKIFNQDEEKAYLAGLVHDCAKNFEDSVLLDLINNEIVILSSLLK